MPSTTGANSTTKCCSNPRCSRNAILAFEEARSRATPETRKPCLRRAFGLSGRRDSNSGHLVPQTARRGGGWWLKPLS